MLWRTNVNIFFNRFRNKRMLESYETHSVPAADNGFVCLVRRTEIEERPWNGPKQIRIVETVVFRGTLALLKKLLERGYAS